MMARLRQTRRMAAGAVGVLREQGPRGIAQRVARLGYYRLGAKELEFPLLDGDIADWEAVRATPRGRPAPAGPLTVGWIMVPPSPGSGGHTTAFRAMSALEDAGHTCVILLYDRFGGDLNRQTEIIRSSWPAVRAEVRRAADPGALDALVATSWQTAHVAAPRVGQVARCFYFVQDYEPYFYPRGAEYRLAEDTYRFGFQGITAGPWLAQVLPERFGMPCDGFEFGADTSVYRYDPDARRDGIAFYAKRDVPRRGYALGLEVLREFARQRPAATIHIYGDPVGTLPFPAVSHGRTSAATLNSIYNTCRVGLGLSFTNVSLIPWELMASGAVPVVNDADHNRAVLRSPNVAWATPSISGLTKALIDAYDGYTGEVGGRCANGVQAMSWEDALRIVVATIERGCTT